MKMIRIKFKKDKDEAIGLLELSKKVRIVCFQDDTYEIPFSALEIINALNIPYEIIKTEGFDNVLRKVRNIDSIKV